MCLKPILKKVMVWVMVLGASVAYAGKGHKGKHSQDSQGQVGRHPPVVGLKGPARQIRPTGVRDGGKRPQRSAVVHGGGHIRPSREGPGADRGHHHHRHSLRNFWRRPAVPPPMVPSVQNAWTWVATPWGYVSNGVYYSGEGYYFDGRNYFYNGVYSTVPPAMQIQQTVFLLFGIMSKRTLKDIKKNLRTSLSISLLPCLLLKPVMRYRRS